MAITDTDQRTGSSMKDTAVRSVFPSTVCLCQFIQCQLGKTLGKTTQSKINNGKLMRCFRRCL